MIEAVGLLKSYKKPFSAAVTVLNGFSFVARDGCVTGILGRNGCGKTTTFRMCAGVVRADGGTLHVDGLDVARSPDRVRERVALLPEVRGLVGTLTGRDILRQYGRLRGLWGKTLEARISEMAELLEMTDILDRYSTGLSRGQAAKVSLARTLIADVPNVILDEPTNGLDLVVAEQVRDQVRRLRRAGYCVVVSSHQMADIEGLCDEVVLLRGGRSVATGDLPALAAAAGFSSPSPYLVSLFKGDLDDVN